MTAALGDARHATVSVAAALDVMKSALASLAAETCVHSEHCSPADAETAAVATAAVLEALDVIDAVATASAGRPAGARRDEHGDDPAVVGPAVAAGPAPALLTVMGADEVGDPAAAQVAARVDAGITPAQVSPGDAGTGDASRGRAERAELVTGSAVSGHAAPTPAAGSPPQPDPQRAHVA